MALEQYRIVLFFRHQYQPGLPVHRLAILPTRTIYVADFAVQHPDGHTEVEDTKSHAMEVFRIKRKLFEARYSNLELKII
ncbi:DUF1064 domain-containing protein [Acididesulfobacillus acetoxydans]|uniref:DUF1064 domain-containing protein n=1 Tax=Acididesulfobacillus acetoxydans TaxID=1561005 RepID=UPI0035568CD7